MPNAIMGDWSILSISYLYVESEKGFFMEILPKLSRRSLDGEALGFLDQNDVPSIPNLPKTRKMILQFPNQLIFFPSGGDLPHKVDLPLVFCFTRNYAELRRKDCNSSTSPVVVQISASAAAKLDALPHRHLPVTRRRRPLTNHFPT